MRVCVYEQACVCVNGTITLSAGIVTMTLILPFNGSPQTPHQEVTQSLDKKNTWKENPRTNKQKDKLVLGGNQ